MPAQLIANAYTDGPALTAAAAASCVPTYIPTTLPAGYFSIGRAWRLRAAGRISNVVTTPGTARFDLRLGGIVAFDTLAIPLNIVAKTNVAWWLDVMLTCRAVGSGTSANLLSQGVFMSEATINTAVPSTGPGPGGVLVPYNAAPVVGAGFNSQSALTFDFFFTQTVATGSMTLHTFQLEQVNP
jgi:hypothetical protein